MLRGGSHYISKTPGSCSFIHAWWHRFEFLVGTQAQLYLWKFETQGLYVRAYCKCTGDPWATCTDPHRETMYNFHSPKLDDWKPYWEHSQLTHFVCYRHSCYIFSAFTTQLFLPYVNISRFCGLSVSFKPCWNSPKNVSNVFVYRWTWAFEPVFSRVNWMMLNIYLSWPLKHDWSLDCI